jgi:hypothetical protein
VNGNGNYRAGYGRINYECLDQAILVAKNQPFKKTAVQKWCKAEGADWAFVDFTKGLKK